MANQRRHQCHTKVFFKLESKLYSEAPTWYIAFYLNILIFYIILFPSQTLSVVCKLKYLHVNYVQKTDHVHIVIKLQYTEQQACQTCSPNLFFVAPPYKLSILPLRHRIRCVTSVHSSPYTSCMLGISFLTRNYAVLCECFKLSMCRLEKQMRQCGELETRNSAWAIG